MENNNNSIQENANSGMLYGNSANKAVKQIIIQKDGLMERLNTSKVVTDDGRELLKEDKA